MDPEKIIAEFYDRNSSVFDMLIRHSRLVAKKALSIAEHAGHLKPDMDFIKEAAMLHDIGIFMTNAESMGCRGAHPYVVHGYLGRLLLEKKGLLRHGLVCERHVGAGITAQDIKTHSLPLPVRDMIPVSVEEKIVCIADKFFSKTGKSAHKERSSNKVIGVIEKYGENNLERFRKWLTLLEA